MKIEKFKVLLYLKKSGTDKSGKAPIMGRITVNRAPLPRHLEKGMPHSLQGGTLPQKTERTPRALSREDFEKIRDVEIPAWRTTHILVRDLFLFACYTGTAYADVVSVTRENLYTDDEGSLWLKYRRKKNELRASVKLLPEALALIEKYHDDNRPTLFPIIYHPNLRRHMKSLAVLAGVSGRLCYHQARHSFASLITLEAGVPIETISRMLGHSDISAI